MIDISIKRTLRDFEKILPPEIRAGSVPTYSISLSSSSDASVKSTVLIRNHPGAGFRYSERTPSNPPEHRGLSTGA